jgi:LysM repeat protein
MKKKIFSFVLAGFLLITLTIAGQNTNYPTKKVNGIEYYIYTVQSGEGLFAVGRRFDILPEEISNANPKIQSGLKTGQQLLIPVHKKTSDKVKIKSANNVNYSAKEFIHHEVKKNQTLFAISNKYKVSQEDIIKYNPGAEKGVREGNILLIPKETSEDKKTEKEEAVSVQKTQETDKTEKKEKTVAAESSKYITHIVQPKETLYSLGRLYNVEVADIVALNPGSESNLVIGTGIKIPKTEGNKATSSCILSDVKNLITGSSKSEENAKVIKIAFLLPFMLDQDKNDPTIERFTDFYSGALVAIENAKQKGISLEIYTYDTEKSEEKITSVLNNPVLKTMDLIIGPAFTNQISYVADFAKENGINTLIPFSSKVPEIESNPYLFQFNPGDDTEIEFSMDLLTGKYKNANIIFAAVPGISSFDEGKLWNDALKKELNQIRKSFTEIELTNSDDAGFKSGLKKGEKNIVLFNTDKYAFISPFIKPLRSNTDEYNVILFEQYSWKNQKEKMPLSIYISPFKMIDNSSKLNTYNEQFTKLFSKDVNIVSPRFDLLGYDLTGYFVSLLNRYGNKFIDKIGSYNYSDYIQSQPRFERLSNRSGFTNQHLYLSEDKSE